MVLLSLTPQRRACAPHVRLGSAGKWYLAGGLDSNSDSKLQAYDFGSDSWTQKADLPFKAGSASSASFNGKVRAVTSSPPTNIHAQL